MILSNVGEEPIFRAWALHVYLSSGTCYEVNTKQGCSSIVHKHNI